jgi:hypothetical protein
MKKLLSFFAIVCLVGIVSVKAQSASDSSYVRNLHYDTIDISNLPVVITDTLDSDSPDCKILKDVREGAWAKGYTFAVQTSTVLNIHMYCNPSDDFDTYIYLLDSNFNILAYNDDWNGHVDEGSCVIRNLPQGRYYVIATQYSDSWTSIDETYYLSLDALSAVDFRGLNYTAATLTAPITDSLGANSQILMEPMSGIYANHAKGYTFQAPQCNFRVSLDNYYRFALVLDSNYNPQPFYLSNNNSCVTQLPHAGMYRLVVMSSLVYDGDTTLSRLFTITTDTVRMVTYATLNYRNINVGDTIADSLVATDPLIVSDNSNNMIVDKVNPSGGLYYVKGYRFQTPANANYIDYNTFDVNVPRGTTAVLLDANYNVLSSTDYTELYYRVAPSTTYNLAIMANKYDATGSYKFVTKAEQDIANVYYVDAINGDDDSSGLTPAAALKTLDEAIYRSDEGVARIYLTEDYEFTDYVGLGLYNEIYPYGKNIKLKPNLDDGEFILGKRAKVMSYNVLQYGITLILGKEGDSLYFLIDSLPEQYSEYFIGACENVEINNLKMRNSVWPDYFVNVSNLIVRNSEFTNDSIARTIFCSNNLKLENITINNNIIGYTMCYATKLTLENTVIDSNMCGEPIELYDPQSEAYLISGRMRGNTTYGEYAAEMADMMGCDTSNFGGIALLFGAKCHWGAGFSIDTNAYVFLDTLSVIIVDENITAPVAARLFPMNVDGSTYVSRPAYSEGRQLLDGSAVASNYSHFLLVQPIDQTWYLHSDGRIYTSDEHAGIAQAQEGRVNIYPNPASDRFYVQLDGTEADEICVLDIYGKQVKRIAATEGTHTIGLQGLAKGIYFVQVRKADTIVATRKLVKD